MNILRDKLLIKRQRQSINCEDKEIVTKRSTCCRMKSCSVLILINESNYYCYRNVLSILMVEFGARVKYSLLLTVRLSI